MAKKKNNPGMMPDLFADFGAGSDATNEQNEEKEAAPEAPETTPSVDNETVPTVLRLRCRRRLQCRQQTMILFRSRSPNR